jgi:hypothetical protein
LCRLTDLVKNASSSDKNYLKNTMKKLVTETNIADKEWLLSKFSPQKNKDLHKHR